jgi:hypothetical protein
MIDNSSQSNSLDPDASLQYYPGFPEGITSNFAVAMTRAHLAAGFTQIPYQIPAIPHYSSLAPENSLYTFQSNHHSDHTNYLQQMDEADHSYPNSEGKFQCQQCDRTFSRYLNSFVFMY